MDKNTMCEPIKDSSEWLHFMRGQVSEKNRRFRVRHLALQGSRSISSLVESNALIRVEADSPVLPEGSQVLVRPLRNEIG